MAKRGGKTRKSMRLFGRLYSPIDHLLQATGDISRSVGKRSSNAVRSVTGLVNNVGRSVTKHANCAVRDVLRRKNRKNRKGTRKTRKQRK
jgi:hypothetical protein